MLLSRVDNRMEHVWPPNLADLPTPMTLKEVNDYVSYYNLRNVCGRVCLATPLSVMGHQVLISAMDPLENKV